MTEATTLLDDSWCPVSILIVITSSCFTLTVLCLLVHVYIVCGEICLITKPIHTNALNDFLICKFTMC